MSILFTAVLLTTLGISLTRARRKKSLYKAGRARIVYAAPGEAPQEPDRWLLSANAIYSVWFERPVDKWLDLEGRPTFKASMGQWELKTRDDLLATLAQLFHQGARRPMHALQRAEPSLPQHNLLAFDLGRFLHLSVAGNALGWLTPDETRVLMLHAGRALQRAYPGWNEFSDAFVAGMVVNRVHKSIEITAQSEARLSSLRQAVRTLQRSKASPWRTVPWMSELPRPQPGDFFDRVSSEQLSEAVFYVDEDAFGPSDQHWALAVGAIYYSWWGQPVDRLIREDRSVLSDLKRDWGIENRQDALGSVMWLYHEGHRGALHQLQRQLPSVPQTDPLAWDMVRLVQVSASAASAGYLRPDEAYNLMLHACRALQGRYASWADMARGFQDGRSLWRRLNEHPQSAELRAQDDSLDRTLSLLRDDPISPWHKLPWNFALAAPEPDDLFSQVSATYLAQVAPQLAREEGEQLN